MNPFSSASSSTSDISRPPLPPRSPPTGISCQYSGLRNAYNRTESVNLDLVNKQKDEMDKLDTTIRGYLRVRALPSVLRSVAILSVDSGQSATGPSQSLPFDAFKHTTEAHANLVKILKELDRELKKGNSSHSIVK